MKVFRTLISATLASVAIIFSASAFAGWHELSQIERNQRIIQQAQHDFGKVCGACKIWVIDVVRVSAMLACMDVTNRGTIQALPATTASPDDFSWVSRSDVSGSPALSPYSMQPGQIIQMRIRYSLTGTTIGPPVPQ